MAQVGVQAPSNLMEMFSSASPMLWDIASQQVNDQTLGNLVNRQQAAQDLDMQQQKLPFELRKLGLANNTAAAQLPGFQAESGLKQNSLARDTATQNDQIKATAAKLAKETSDAHYGEFENGVYAMLSSQDPKIRQQGQAMFPYLKAIATERDKIAMQGNQRMREIGATTQGQKDLMQMQIDAGRFKDKNASLGFWGNFHKLKSAKDKHAALLLEAVKEEQAGNADGGLQLRQMAEEIRPQAEAEINARATPPAVDISQLGNIPTVAAPTISPQARPKQPVQLTPQDKEALAGANANPTHPRAAQIKQKLGVK